MDNAGYIGVVSMDFSKVIDRVNLKLLIAKLYAYRFSKEPLKLIHSYISSRW